MTELDLKRYLQDRKRVIEENIKRLLPSKDHYPPLLHQAMHYSVFAGGKRIRPVLHLAAVDAAGGATNACMPFACALELIHTYSLIHDDLPAMDDDDMRRGQPTNHVVFGEAIAILAGDALLTEAFRLVSEDAVKDQLPHAALVWATQELAHAAGSLGMVGGQAMDILSEGKKVDPEVLDYIHSHKTAALIRVSVRTGAILSGVSERTLEKFTLFGEALGLAFQIRDDLLNVEGDSTRLGKAVGTDESRKKITYPSLRGIDQARRRLDELVEESLETLSEMDQRSEPLRAIARYMAVRDH